MKLFFSLFFSVFSLFCSGAETFKGKTADSAEDKPITGAKIVSVGLVQMQCLPDRELNLQKAEKEIRKAADMGAQIICLPELFATEYFCQTRDDQFFSLAQSIPGPQTLWLSGLAKELEVVLVTSLFERSAEEQFFNTAVVIDADGTLLGKYRKMHIPNDPENGYDEAYYFADGNLGCQTFATRYAKIAPMICWDQ